MNPFMVAAVAVVVGLPFLLKRLGLTHDEGDQGGDDDYLYGHAGLDSGGGGGGAGFFAFGNRGLAGPQEQGFYDAAAGTGYGADYSDAPAGDTQTALIDSGPGASSSQAISGGIAGGGIPALGGGIGIGGVNIPPPAVQQQILGQLTGAAPAPGAYQPLGSSTYVPGTSSAGGGGATRE